MTAAPAAPLRPVTTEPGQVVTPQGIENATCYDRDDLLRPKTRGVGQKQKSLADRWRSGEGECGSGLPQCELLYTMYESSHVVTPQTDRAEVLQVVTVVTPNESNGLRVTSQREEVVTGRYGPLDAQPEALAEPGAASQPQTIPQDRMVAGLLRCAMQRPAVWTAPVGYPSGGLFCSGCEGRHWRSTDRATWRCCACLPPLPDAVPALIEAWTS